MLIKSSGSVSFLLGEPRLRFQFPELFEVGVPLKRRGVTKNTAVLVLKWY